jgi:nucleotidyltransferase substrate binding protein (TIGR01987 family)
VDRLTERLELAKKALTSLEELATLAHPSKVERDAAIQRFEYTCEATWKAIQLGLRQEEGVPATSPKAIMRASRQTKLLDDDATRLALSMVDDRNQTVHTYNEAVADAIYGRLAGYVPLLRAWLAAASRWIAS